MKSKHQFIVLLVFIIILILFYSFSVYEDLRTQKIEEEKYVVEEIIEPEDIVPDETAEIPTVEGGEEVEVLNEVTITIKNLRFEPEKVTISPGTTVAWVNNDTVAHKVVAYDRLFYGPRLGTGDKYAFTFTQEGIHRYFDAVFPKIGRGRIIVKEEPLPMTGGVVGIDLGREERDGKFALLVALFIIMISGLSHAIYKHPRT